VKVSLQISLAEHLPGSLIRRVQTKILPESLERKGSKFKKELNFFAKIKIHHNETGDLNGIQINSNIFF